MKFTVLRATFSPEIKAASYSVNTPYEAVVLYMLWSETARVD